MRGEIEKHSKACLRHDCPGKGITFQSIDHMDLYIHSIPSQLSHQSLILSTLEIPILTPAIKHPIILPKWNEKRDTRSGTGNIWNERVFGVWCLN